MHRILLVPYMAQQDIAHGKPLIDDQPQDLYMSKKIHPVISITGSSGAGTATVKNTFEHIFMCSIITSSIIEDHSYQHFSRVEMNVRDDKA